jgi:hypothetical protein
MSNLTGLQGGALGRIANGTQLGSNNPAFVQAVGQAGTDAANGVNSAFAAAGRGGSPGQDYQVGKGVAAAEAPLLANQYNVDLNNQMQAAQNLYGAGNQTYGLLNANNQQGNANMMAGAGLSQDALNASTWGPRQILNAAEMRFGIPAGQLTGLLGSLAPVNAQFGQQNGTSNTQNQASGAQQFGQIGQGIGSVLGGLRGLFAPV